MQVKFINLLFASPWSGKKRHLLGETYVLTAEYDCVSQWPDLLGKELLSGPAAVPAVHILTFLMDGSILNKLFIFIFKPTRLSAFHPHVNVTRLASIVYYSTITIPK